MQPEPGMLVGYTLELDGNSLLVTRMLGSGYTSHVYLGEMTQKNEKLQVAVKVAREDSSQVSRFKEILRKEGETLSVLARLERDANESNGSVSMHLNTVPVYYGYGEYRGLPFIVMEYINGTKIDQVIGEKGVLPERIVLKIAWQLYRTMGLLYTGLHKSMIDLQLKDLILVNESDGQLKILDFGTLEDMGDGIKENSVVDRDLQRIATFLVFMLTGINVPSKIGEEQIYSILSNAKISRESQQLISSVLAKTGSSVLNASKIATDFLHRFETFESQVFMLMPFTLEFRPIYTIFKATLAELGWKCQRADEIYDVIPIIQKIENLIIESRFIIADLSSGNRNVLFELGIAHSLGKNVILISQQNWEIPQFFQHLNYLIYGTQVTDTEWLRKQLDSAIRAIDKSDLPAIFQKTEVLIDPRLCIAFLPNDATGKNLFEQVIKPVTIAKNLGCVRPTDLLSLEGLSEQVWIELQRCHLVIVDITQNDSVYFYLAGLAYGLHKDVIFLVEENQEVSLDIRINNYIYYSIHTQEGISKAKEDFAQSIKAVQPVDFVRQRNVLEKLFERGQISPQSLAKNPSLLSELLYILCDLISADLAVIYPYKPSEGHYYDVGRVAASGLLQRIDVKEKPRLTGISAILQEVGEIVVYDLDIGEITLSEQPSSEGLSNETILTALRNSKFIQREAVKSFIGISLRNNALSNSERKGQEVGALFISYRASHLFMREEIELIRWFAGQLTILMQSSLTYIAQREEQELEKQLKQIESWRMELENRDLEMKNLWSWTLETASMLFRRGFDFGTVFLYDSIRQYLTAEVLWEKGKIIQKGQMPEEERGVPVDKGIVGRTVRTRKAQHVPNARYDPDFIQIYPLLTSSELAVPISNSKGSLIGVLNLEFSETNSFTEQEAKLCQRLANIVSILWDEQGKEQIQPSTAHLTWLHLSDLQFRQTGEIRYKITPHELVRFIKRYTSEHQLNLDFIFVTGDIVFSGGGEQAYNYAAAFFDELLQITGLDNSRLCIVPGNHDLDRGKLSQFVRKYAEELRDRSAVRKFFANKNNWIGLMEERLSYYKRFVERYNPQFFQEEGPYLFAKSFNIFEKKVAILGLNTVWISDEEGNLILGEPQLREALSGTADAEIRIALMHHPWQALKDFDAEDCRKLLAEYCHYILHGHVHQTLTYRIHTTFTAGVGQQNRSLLFNLVNIDLVASQGLVHELVANENLLHSISSIVDEDQKNKAVARSFTFKHPKANSPDFPEWVGRISKAGEDILWQAEKLRQVSQREEIDNFLILGSLKLSAAIETKQLFNLAGDENYQQKLSEKIGIELGVWEETIDQSRLIEFLPYSIEVSKTLDAALAFASQHNLLEIQPYHIFIGIISLDNCEAAKWIAAQLKIDRVDLYRLIIESPNGLPSINAIQSAQRQYYQEQPISISVTKSYQLYFSKSKPVVSVGESVSLEVNLLPAPEGKGSATLTGDVQEIYCFLEAEGVIIQGDNIVRLAVDPGTGRFIPAQFSLIGELVGTREFRMTLYSENVNTGRIDLYTTRQTISVIPPTSNALQITELEKINVRVTRKADFILRVLPQVSDEFGSRIRLIYRLNSVLPDLHLTNQEVGGAILSANQFSHIQTLVKDFIAHRSELSPDDSRQKLLSLGAYLFDTLFPSQTANAFRGYYWLAQNQLRTWLIVESGSLNIPWELIAPYGYNAHPNFFLGERYRISRWVDGVANIPPNEIPSAELALVSYDPEHTNLIAWQRLLNTIDPLDLPVASNLLAPVHGIQILHQMDISSPTEIVPVDRTRPKQAEDDISRSRLGLRFKRPVVTISAVGKSPIAKADWVLRDQILPFVRSGASAVAGSWWPILEIDDMRFWRAFHDAIHDRLSLSAAFQHARLTCKRLNPARIDWLAYVLFGDPTARPYWPEESQGYTAVECLNPDEPLQVGKKYYFRASIRKRPPLWYQDRLIQPEEFPNNPKVLFIAPECDVGTRDPIDMHTYGRTMVQATIFLIPLTKGEFTLTVRFLDGDERLQTIRTRLLVGTQRKDSNQ